MSNKDFIQNSTDLIKELCLLLQSLHPVKTLIRAYWEFFVQHSKIETESDIGKHEIYSRFLVEYLQSLFISIELKKPLKQPNDKEWEEIKKKVRQIYDICQLPLINKDNSEFLKEEDILLFGKVFYSWHIRGKRYIAHEYEHLNKLLTPHDEILKELYGVTGQEIAEGVKNLFVTACSIFPQSLQKYTDILKQFKPFYDTLKETQQSEQKIQNLLQNKIKDSGLKEKKEELERKLFSDNLFDVEKITGWPKNFIKKFSAPIGSNKSFLVSGKYPGTPLQLLPITEKPFLEYNSKIYLFNLYILQDYLYRNMQSAILKDKPTYSKKWNKRQNITSEKLPFRILEEIIGQHEQIKNFYYTAKDDDGNESLVECDGIILFEEWLFVIEVKSGKMSNKPPAQNVISHFQSIKKLLSEPAGQGRRFIETLKNEKTLQLYDEKKRVTKTISTNDFKQSIVMAVSLEQLTDISPQVQNFKALGLNSEGEAILCISIDDLRVYRDLSNGVVEFFHFLTERRKAFYNNRLTLDDELDHFGMYLKHNQYHDITKHMPESNLNIFGGYRDEIDRYLDIFFLNPERAVKPKRYMPPVLTAIIKDLEFNRKPGFIKAGITVYSLSDEAKDRLNQKILNTISLQNTEEKIRPFSCLLNDLCVSFVIRMPGIQPNFEPTDYATKNMFMKEVKEILLLDISADKKGKIINVFFKWIKASSLSDKDTVKYKKEAEKLSNSIFFNQMQSRDKKKIGRNEKCPCGSGRKYKKCHGRNPH